MASSIDCRHMSQLPVLKMVRDLAAGDVFTLSMSKDREEIICVERVDTDYPEYGTCCVHCTIMTWGGGWAPTRISLDSGLAVLIIPTH
jgi:hypothetical protein